jgi:hypothetical protein
MWQKCELAYLQIQKKKKATQKNAKLEHAKRKKSAAQSINIGVGCRVASTSAGRT